MDWFDELTGEHRKGEADMKHSQVELAAELESFIHDGQRSWQEIMDYVTGTLGESVKNWMFVRGALQILMNSDSIIRTDDIRKEEYMQERRIK